MDEPLSIAAIEAVLQTNSRGHLIKRECSTLELKEAFNWGSKAKYAKTLAAFANAKGGYLVFGVKNRPHELVGFKSSNFENLDDADITQFLNEYFDREICIERRVFESGGKEFGIVYVSEAASKPVICTRNSGDELKEGDIYYRYRATSRRIRHAELREIIDVEARRLHDHLLNTVMQVGKIGVANTVVLDTREGTIHAPDGAVIVDEQILERVKFIREGKFDEKEGDATLRVIADAIPGQVVTHQKAVAIRTPEILRAFFGHGLPEGAVARDALEALPYESSSMVPAFYFAREAGLSDDDAAMLVENSEAAGQTKQNVAEHLRHGSRCAGKGSVTPGASAVAGKRRSYLDTMTAGALDPDAVPDDDLHLALQAITHMSRGQMEENQDVVFSALEKWHPRTREYPLKQAYGVAICHVDEVLFRG